jgi:rfaE bifunctional protein nucleotidyltransferase chain/domain
MDTSSKIKTRFEMDNIVQSLKQQGKTIVTCNGCFDILHIGHIEFLKDAINSDSSIKANKGPSRPINNENNRANILAALRMIDYVTIFNEKTPIRLLEQIRPNVHCNGEEYGENCIEAETIRKNNGKIHLIKLKQGFSTTNIINKIRES